MGRKAKGDPRERVRRYYKRWQKVNLSRVIADFYMLSAMVGGEGSFIERNARYRWEAFSKRWAREVAIYLNMAVGGEFRFIRNARSGDGGECFEEDCDDYCPDCSVCHSHEGYSQPARSGLNELDRFGFPEQVRERVRLASTSGDRTDMWAEWLDISGTEIGNPALLEPVEKAFKDLEWPGGYGGEAWSRVARLLKLYRRGDIPDTVFLDQAFHLQHNGGCVFDKAFNLAPRKKVKYLDYWGKAHWTWELDHTASVEAVLDLQGSSNLDDLVEHASQNIQSMWLQYKSKDDIAYRARWWARPYEGD